MLGTDLEVIHNMPSYMSIYRFVRVRISILVSKTILGHLEAVGADLIGQPGTDWEVTHNIPPCMS